MRNPHKLLMKAFERQKKVNPSLSLRVLAEKTDVSSGFLSKVLSGQKGLTPTLAEKLCLHLRVDSLQKDQIMLSLEDSLLSKKFGAKKRTSREASVVVKALEEMTLMSADAEWLLEKWHRLVILDLVTCDNFSEDPKWIAERLGLSPSDAREALAQLELHGFLKRNGSGRLQKTHNRLRFPTKFSKEVVRNFHAAQMNRAIKYMNEFTGQIDFEKRLITNIVVASNPENLEKAKAILHRAIYEAGEVLSQGSCAEVYQINLQLFPHTRLPKA